MTLIWEKQERNNMSVEFFRCCCVRQNISLRRLVISRTWNWRKVVRRTLIRKPNGLWNHVADLMKVNLSESGHLLFRGTSALFRGALKSKGGERSWIHYNADPATAELLLRSIVSVNQMSINGAAANWCEELAQQISDLSSSSTRNPVGSPGQPGAATQRKIRKRSRRHSSNPANYMSWDVTKYCQGETFFL